MNPASPAAKADVSRDSLLGGRVALIQPKRGYRVAIDPVFLAAACPAAPGESVLDVGAGTGAASFCLAARVKGLEIVALERDPLHATLLEAGIAANPGLGGIEALRGDLADPPAAIAGRSFDHVITNPPFFPPGERRPSADPSAEAAACESMPLADWIGHCLRRLRSGGSFTIVHRAARLAEIQAALLARAASMTIYPLWPSDGAAAASRVIVVARKGGRAPSVLHRGLVLHDAAGGFLPAARSVLDEAASLDGALFGG